MSLTEDDQETKGNRVNKGVRKGDRSEEVIEGERTKLREGERRSGSHKFLAKSPQEKAFAKMGLMQVVDV